jgi:hypothetical protein
MQLELFEDNKVEKPKETGVQVKHCSMCDQHLPIENFGKLLVTGTGKQFYQGYCRSCMNKRGETIRKVRRTAPPVPDSCECCGKSFEGVSKKNIHMDHCEITKSFRGWLCMHCNVGLGYLGDNIEGLQNGIKYLERHNERQS